PPRALPPRPARPTGAAPPAAARGPRAAGPPPTPPPWASGRAAPAAPTFPTSPSFHPILEMSQLVRKLAMGGPQSRFHRTQRLLQATRDLAVRQPFEIRERHHAPQLVRKRREGGVHLTVQRPSRHGGFVRRTVPGLLVGPLRLLPTVRLPPPPPAPTQLVERPITSDRQDPRHQWSAPRVVLVDMTPHLHEDVTDDFFGLVLIVQDAKRQAEHPRCERVVQLLQCALVSRLEPAHQGALFLLTETS